MERHRCKPSTNLSDIENDIQVEKNVLEETADSKKLSIIIDTPSNLPLNNGDVDEKKLLESEAKISKLISEIDLLKKKVS